ncbi:peptidase domain-containing ABC transporter [Flavihumibacter fluvii]|uniref:peptidase domain-containing ABC transporter n=1 Tax=Flavihumibacter fluvii TaxID=2838157 RepID=UPI001BDEDE8E|nr:ATP-binding cassette domain-containing protein [Flavihumibacter fluvii]ULQ54423.1 ATP-binding cassette domain-containing protein [Flavihumibacter fluvii]
MADKRPNPIQRILAILKFQRTEISSIYFYAILNGLVQLSLPLGIQSIISFVLGGSISTSIIILIILVVAGVFFTGLFQVNQMRMIEKVQQQLFVRYSFEYAWKIPRLNLKSIDKYYLPELVNRFFDTVTLQKGLAKLLLDIPSATIQILFGLLLLSFYHPVFILFGLTLVLLLFFILRYSGNRGLDTSIEESNYKYEMAGWLEELARVVTTFKFSKGSSLHLQNSDKTVFNYLSARTRHFKILLFQYWTLVGFKIAITASMLIVGSLLLVNQQLNIGQFIAAEIIILMVISSVEKLIINLDNVYDVLTAVEKLGKVTDLAEELEGKLALEDTGKGMSIQVNELSFEYQEGYPVLSNLNFSIAPGEKIQVMGSHGSGKSTLIRLLSGSYQPFKGVISLDNISINNYTLDSIRQQTGILLSNQELFKGSLLENITLGNQSIPYTEINRLAEILGLKDFFDRTPAGLSLAINPTGDRLPRKIVQKLLLLRALVNAPRLLLLEEPWLGLEMKYAQQIKNYLLHEIPNTTVIIISNDIHFAEFASRVIIIEDGNLKAAGKWQEVQPIIKIN